jgi:hypothetical protein
MPNRNENHEVPLDDLLPKRYVELVGEIQLDDGEIEVKVKSPNQKLIQITISNECQSQPRIENEGKPANLEGANLASQAKVRHRGISHSSESLSQAIKGEYSYAKLGLLLGLAAIIGGVVLCIHGTTGSTSWSAKLLALSSEINDAVPGVVLFIVGLFMIVATKPKINLNHFVSTRHPPPR